MSSPSVSISGSEIALRPCHDPRNDPCGTGIYFFDPCLCCGLQLSSGHFESSSRGGRARQAHRLGRSIRKFQPYTHSVISVPAAVFRTQFWKNVQTEDYGDESSTRFFLIF